MMYCFWGIRVVWVTYSMNTLGPSRKGTRRHAREGVSRKMVLNLDLNSPPVECQLPEGTSGCRHPRISRGTSISVDPQPGNPAGRQQGSSAPSNDCLNGGLIDVELIEDEVVILSSPRGFPLVLASSWLLIYLSMEGAICRMKFC